MKRLYKYFIISFSAIVGVLFLILAGMFLRTDENNSRLRLIQILDQLERKYEMEQTALKEKMALWEVDYHKRAEAVAFMVSGGEQFRDMESLQNLKSVMNIDKINFIDEHGVICLSANPNVVGVDLHDHAEAKGLLDLALNGKKGDTLVSLGATDTNGTRIADYVAIYLGGPEFAAVEITFYAAEIDEALEKAGLKNVIEGFLTEYDLTVAAFRKNGELIGLSTNNVQNTEVANVSSNAEMAQFLQSTLKGRTAKINNDESYILSREYENLILTAYLDKGATFQMFMTNMIALTIVLALTAILVVLMLRALFQRYILRDFHHMEEDIEGFISGNQEQQIRPCENQELEHLNQAIRRMRDGYRNKSERLNRIIGGIDSNVAAFECLEYTNQIFISDNMQNVLGVGNRQIEAMRSSLKGFSEYMSRLEAAKDGENLVHYNNKWLKITSYRLEHEYFGLVIDKTEECEEQQRTMQELHRTKRMAQLDGLTGLYGRMGFEQTLQAYLDNKDHQSGIMMLFDMDNFKRINDALGHPEGDRALRIMAKCLKSEFRHDDITGRLGGDEFVVFMPGDIPRDDLEEKLKKFLDCVRSALAQYQPYEVSVSIGVAFYNKQLHDYKSLYEGADTALYIAKELGKNRYFINDENIRCMEKKCLHCRRECPRRRILEL